MANIQVDELPTTDVTLQISKADMTAMVLGQATLDDLLKSGEAKLTGNAKLVTQLVSTLDDFDGMFEILPMPAN
ncbi:alkyl sulfatase [Vibrio rotiferianus CAIM 577 = LMG 21460]|nr:alkyl sulfatase [Vibrio rotiferianus CAIM 577 = LMG 21460]